MHSGFSTPTAGMEVIGADNHHVGRVKEVHDTDFIVQRVLQPSVHVPIDAIQDVTPKGVVLALSAGDVDELFWVHAGEDMYIELTNIYD